MVNFKIEDYLTEEKINERQNFDGVFYGELEDKPSTEIMLFNLQNKYLSNGRPQEIWEEMFKICWSYMRSLILQRQRGKSFVEPELIDDQTTSATLAFMSQYLTRPEFEVGASFAGMMKWKIIEVLYKNSPKNGSPISLQLEVSDDGKTTLEGLIAAEGIEYSPEDLTVKRSSYEIIEEILNELDATINVDNKYYIMLVVRLYILLCLKHPKNRHSKKMFLDKWAQDFKIKKLIDFVMLEIKNRLLEESYNN